MSGRPPETPAEHPHRGAAAPGRRPARAAGAPAAPQHRLVLPVRTPFRLDLTCWTLRRAPVNEMDRWEEGEYRRVFAVDGTAIETVVTQEAPDELVLTSTGAPVATTGDTRGGEAGALAEAGDRISSMLGLDLDLAPFYDLAEQHPRLFELVDRFRGVRPPRFASLFEGLVNGIACQQLSLTVGIHLLNRLAHKFGPKVDGQAGFPDAETLASVDAAELRPLGFSERKARYIVGLAQEVASGRFDLDLAPRLDDQELLTHLTTITGVGRWTAQYLALRGLGRLDTFPLDDIGGQNNVQAWLGLSIRPKATELERLLEPYRPYRGLIYFHLLLRGLDERGLLGLQS